MAALTGNFISQSYGGLIHLTTNTGIVSNTPTMLQDGLGNDLNLYVNSNGSISGSSFTGSLFGTASQAVSASWAPVNATSSYALQSLSSSYALTASFASNVPATASYALQALTASFALTASIARDLVIRARNGNNASLPAGTVVHITGASGDNPIFNTASFDTELLSANTLGILAGTAATNQDVDVVVNGIVLGVNTDPANGYVAGDIIYLSSSGQFTKVQPQAPLQVVTLGQVLRAQQNNGSIYVSINNGWELDELHNVRIVSSSFGDLLVNSGSLWINSKQLSGSYGLTGSLAATSFTGSLFGTSSWSSNAVSASFATSASFASNALTASFALNASGAVSFPFTGSAVITGSLTVTGSAFGNVVALTISSNTASVDLTRGSYFTLTLPTGSTFLNITNPRPGITANLVITTNTNSTASFSSNVKLPATNKYIPTSLSQSIDILSLLTVDTSTVYVTNAPNFVCPLC